MRAKEGGLDTKTEGDRSFQAMLQPSVCGGAGGTLEGAHPLEA
jgi:hypothetical protein